MLGTKCHHLRNKIKKTQPINEQAFQKQINQVSIRSKQKSFKSDVDYWSNLIAT